MDPTEVNASNIINASKQVDQNLIEQFSQNKKIPNPAFNVLIIVYTILITFGAAGNILVVIAVLRKPAMRIARNMFILNLAVSDLLLCLVTMPLTLMEILTKYWPLGKYAFVCKMIGTLQATSIFVSTISITAIALDRYQVIVYPTRDNLQVMGAVIILTGIWILALVLASPMFLIKRLVSYDIPLTKYGIGSIAYCIEDWPIEHGRIYYSAFSLCIQYLLPILIVSAAYFRIYLKLKNRIPTSVGLVNKPPSERRAERGRRMQRTNCLLVSIALIFGISWLPLNFFNLYADIYLAKHAVTEQLLVGYAICHMTGMSSACSNPLLYGWLNENFRKEFRSLLCRGTQNSTANLNGTSKDKCNHGRESCSQAPGKLVSTNVQGGKGNPHQSITTGSSTVVTVRSKKQPQVNLSRASLHHSYQL
ncbi:unnamed protein product [Hermetia illucens]|uniref:G-protein coupled receptors family 1 profile domain-containing protein n=1 Tax=Hermetia illucens TaxID=343691 RepID=A0A7R8YUE9_HERIL|nr:unnamed protein product [Hermetia illucens]